MTGIADTPQPPYYAVIFTSLQTDNLSGYHEAADRMLELAADQAGFLGVESAREGLGITVSYWQDIESIRAWQQHGEHRQAQAKGRQQWYWHYKVRIARVERDYNKP